MVQHHRLAGDVLLAAVVLEVEMVVLGNVGVEIGPSGLHHHLAQQTGTGELVQGVVDGGLGDMYPRLEHITVELLRSEVAVAAIEQQLGQAQTLPRGPQARRRTWARTPALGRVGIMSSIRAVLWQRHTCISYIWCQWAEA